jgi:hypothetical protein
MQNFMVQAKIIVFKFWKRASWNNFKRCLSLETVLDNMNMKYNIK